LARSCRGSKIETYKFEELEIENKDMLLKLEAYKT
jgi:hypothetical protein